MSALRGEQGGAEKVEHRIIISLMSFVKKRETKN